MATPTPDLTVDTFYETMDVFLQDLQEIFPDEKGLVGLYELFKMAGKDKNAFLEGFLEQVAPYQQLIINRDEAFLEKAKDVEFLKGVNLEKNWKDPELDDECKNGIWDYIQKLYQNAAVVKVQTDPAFSQLSTVMEKVPADVFSQITDMTEQMMSEGVSNPFEMAQKIMSSDPSIAERIKSGFGGGV